MDGLIGPAAVRNLGPFFANGRDIPSTLAFSSRVPSRTLGPRGVELLLEFSLHGSADLRVRL